MRYQERIYIQNDNRAIRNKDILNVNMSSDFCVFKSPKFNLSGATKVQCDQITLNLTGYSFNNMLTAATNNCFVVDDINIGCYSDTEWETRIYANMDLVYSSVFDTENSLTGTPTDTQFLNSVTSGFDSLGYDYTQSGSTYTIFKPYGVKELEVDISVNFNLFTGLTCPAGYTNNIGNDGCTKITTTAATYNGSGTTIIHGDVDTVYSEYGTFFYPNISTLSEFPLYYDVGGILKNQSGNTITALNVSNSSQNNSFWYNSGNTSNGRLNQVGLSALTGTYVGFSKCIDISYGGTYYVGLAADNNANFKVNGILIVNLINDRPENFKNWSVFPVQLNSGKNIIEMLGENTTSASSFAAEIYSPLNYNTLTGATSTGATQANVIFSTLNFVGSTWDIGSSVGYSCPSGFALDVCSGYVCSQILKTGYTLTCTAGTACDTSNEIAFGQFPYVNNTSQGVYIVDGGINTTSSIPFTFDFTGNTNSFSTTTTTFNYKIYKFNNNLNLFTIPPVYESNDISYSAFSGSNQLNVIIPLSGLSLDGDYLVKGYFKSVAETDILGRLGKVLNTYDYNKGSSYQLYNQYLDYYFIAISKADKPLFSQSPVSGNTVSNSLPLYQQVILVDDSSSLSIGTSGSTFTLSNTYVGDIFVTLNGLVLSKDYDYILNGQTLIFLGTIHIGDIITIVYTKTPSPTLISDSISINTTIPSGSTNSQGTYNYFYNTTTNKYEIYTQRTPIINSNIIVILNGVTLSNNIDYYQSTTNQNRIILEGTIMVGDIITIIYYPQANIINGINYNSNIIKWYIPNQQNQANGSFILQYSSTPTFSSYTVSDTISYQPYITSYSGVLTLTGSVGITWYYRVENKKEYTSICGDLIESIAYSEIIPVVIQTNAINSY